MLKVCQGCNSQFEGRRDAKTCSARCRKRLHRAAKALKDELGKISAEAASELNKLGHEVVGLKQATQTEWHTDEGGFVAVSDPAPATTAAAGPPSGAGQPPPPPASVDFEPSPSSGQNADVSGAPNSTVYSSGDVIEPYKEISSSSVSAASNLPDVAPLVDQISDDPSLESIFKTETSTPTLGADSSPSAVNNTGSSEIGSVGRRWSGFRLAPSHSRWPLYF